MGFDFNCLNSFNIDTLGPNKKCNYFFLQVAKLLTAISLDNDNGLFVNIEKKDGKCYASIHFAKYLEDCDNINFGISLSDASFINQFKFFQVLSSVSKYLEDTLQCAFEENDNKVDKIFYSTISKMSNKKKYLEEIGDNSFGDKCGLEAFRNVCNILYSYNELTDADEMSDLNLTLISAISNYFACNRYENLNEIKTLDFYDKQFEKLYKILELDGYSKRKHLTEYIINEDNEYYWIVKSIAKHLIVTECNYDEILSVNRVRLSRVDGELAQIQFYNYDEPQNILIATAIQFTEESLRAFQEYNQIFKSCNFNKRNGSIDGEMSIIFDLPPFEEVLQEHKDLEEGLVFLY